LDRVQPIPSRRRGDRLWERFAALAIARPWLIVAAGFALFAATVPFAARLYGDLRTDLRELLPQGAPSAVALEELERRVGGLASLVAVAALVAGLAAAPLRGMARDPLLIGLVLCGAGAFAAAGALLDWTWWYAASGKAALFRRVLGHEGTRAFYALLGGALLGCGLRVLLG